MSFKRNKINQLTVIQYKTKKWSFFEVNRNENTLSGNKTNPLKITETKTEISIKWKNTMQRNTHI